MSHDDALAEYTAFYGSLGPDRTGELRRLCAAEMRFRDPFCEVSGVDAYVRILDRMFIHLTEPRFRVHGAACNGATGYLRWTFTYKPAPRAELRTIEGMSEVTFDGDSRVISHIDHWDAASQVYEKVFGLGAVLQAIRRRIARRSGC